METFLFWFFGIVAVIGSALVVLNRNPVYSALSLVMTLFSVAALYVLLGAYFVAAVQVLVYAGAIVVLFLFVLMLLNVGHEESIREAFRFRTILGALLGLVFVVSAGWTMWSLLVTDSVAERIPSDAGHTQSIGRLLFQNYLVPFEITSVILLAGLVGVVVLIRFHGRPRRSGKDG